MSFVQRKIDVTITLGTGDFGDGNGNAVTLSGYRVAATVQKFGQPSTDVAEVRIYGVSASIINTLTRLGKPLAYPRDNQISISAGDDQSGMSVVYSGTIFDAYGDYDGLPDVCLMVTAFYDLINSSKPVAPVSFPGTADASVIAALLAAQMGLSFQNEGVTGVLSNQYLAGSSKQMIDKLAQAGNFEYTTSGGTSGQSLVIWPKGSSQGAMGPLIAPPPAGTMVGYPKYSDAGVTVTDIYRPGMNIGTPFQLQSSLTGAVGQWFVLSLDYDLEANNPTGANSWFMHVEAQRASLAS